MLFLLLLFFLVFLGDIYLGLLWRILQNPADVIIHFFRCQRAQFEHWECQRATAEEFAAG